MAILKLSCIGAMTVLLSICMYLLDSRCESFRKLPYMARQVIIGCVFGAMAVFGTEFGVPFEGAMVNIRDAAPVCAGMIFGGPAGLIAGLIGGVERWFAVYWGVGAYTRIACTVGTIFAGAIAAFVRRFLMEEKRASAIYTVGIAIVAEVFHMMMVFITNISDYVYALTVVRHCAPIMIVLVAITAGAASFIVNLISSEQESLIKKVDGIAEKIGLALFITVSIASMVMVGFVVYYQQNIADQQAKSTMENTLSDMAAGVEFAVENIDNPEEAIITSTRNRHIGNEGLIVVMTEDMKLVADSANDEEYSITTASIRAESDRIEAMKEGKIYYWESEGREFHCMIKRIGEYVILAFYPKDEADIIKYASSYLTAFAIVIILAAIFIQIYFLIRKIVIRNIREINDKLAKITDGNLDTVVAAGGSDEFVSLSDDINETVNTMKHYIKEAETRMDKELELARSIQYSALNSEFPESNNFEIYGTMDTAKEVGGDFYDFYRIDDDRIAFLVADVSGKGVPAALFMMRSKTLIKSLVDSGSDVATVLTKANEELCRYNEAEMFVTAWLGMLDLRTNVVSFANAGHNRPVLVRKGQKAEFLKCRSGLVLAGMEGIRYRTEEIKLERGDSLFLYTDGVTEATNADDELFSDERLLDKLSEAEAMNLPYMCRYIRNSIDEFVGDAPQFDDITMIAVKIKNEEDVDIEKVVVPNMDSVAEVEEYFERRGQQLEIPMALGMKINIIIDELYSNVVRYSGASIAKIGMSRDGDILSMTFKDNGIEYNPLEKDDPDVTLSAEDRNIGGLGIFMVKKMTESMDYERISGKNILTVRIKLEESKGRKKIDLDALDAMLGE